MPPGYAPHEITHIMNVEDVWETKLAAMYCHTSQQHDIDRLLKRHSHLPKEEYFIEVKK